MIPRQSNPDFHQQFSTAFTLLNTHQYADAYSIFYSLDKNNEHPAVSFNLALCTMMANEMDRAMMYIEKATMQLRKTIPQSIITDSVYDKLLAIQCNTADYGLPMDKDYPLLFPKNAEQRVLRLSVDIYCELGLWDKVRRIASILESKNYKNVNQALEKTK